MNAPMMPKPVPLLKLSGEPARNETDRQHNDQAFIGNDHEFTLLPIARSEVGARFA